jgi:hypothetical protein
MVILQPFASTQGGAEGPDALHRHLLVKANVAQSVSWPNETQDT